MSGAETVKQEFNMSFNDKSDIESLFLDSLTNEHLVMICTTVDTGFEWQAVDECKEKLHKNLKIIKDRGKIYFNAPMGEISKVQNMRSIDNIFIVADVQKFKFSDSSQESDLELFKDAVHNKMKLEKTLNAWKNATGFLGKMYPTTEEYMVAQKDRSLSNKPAAQVANRGRKRGLDPSETQENDVLKYRVTCERTGKHTFESANVARAIGGELQDKYLWLVDLSSYHLEILCKLVNNELVTHLRVTHSSKHRRNIMAFGPTTLRATVCYNLLSLANPKPGEIIVDPMCGGGSIPIEAAFAYPDCYITCGDNHPKAVDRAKCNIDASGVQKTDLMHWSAAGLPLKDCCIDIVVTDMPFGKRSGRMSDNRILYKQFLIELGRVVKQSIGRMVLLTYDRRSLSVALQAAGDLFRVMKTLGVNIGGLQAAVYVLKRTDVTYEKYKPKVPNRKTQ